MKTITKEYEIYEFSELSEEAKERVKERFIDTGITNDMFYEDVLYDLGEKFPNSKLSPIYSLSSCQGDGFNIEGSLDLLDYLKYWDATAKEKRTMEFYIKQSVFNYEFEKNDRYGYSCKFIDRKHIEDTIDEFIEEMEYQQMRGLKREVISKFLNDMIDYFEDLDHEFEKQGYETIYKISNEDMEETCIANDWEFTEDGEIFY